MLFCSSNGMKYDIKIHKNVAMTGDLITINYPNSNWNIFECGIDVQQEIIYWDNCRKYNIDIPDDLREYCRKLVKNIILL